MKFAKLAEYMEKLEGTSSRLDMTRILAEMFSQVDGDEGKIVAYLSAGMLGPKYNNPDMGMAEKQAVKAVALAFDLSEENATKEFKKSGDLGRTVEELKKKNNNGSDLAVKDVYERLLEMAKVSGNGSQGTKIELLAKLINDLEPTSAKYAIKMAVAKMRAGFSDMTVLDSLSWMMTGDKSLREVIENIYNVRADLGEVVRIIKSLKSPESLSSIKINPVVGTPVLVARAERAKSPKEIWERNGVSAAEHKLDGLRIEAHVKYNSQLNTHSLIKLFSRGLENVTKMYPDIVEGLERQVKKECILDGEMIAVGKDGKYLPFQETVQRKRKYDILEMMAQVPLKYYTFDLLSLNGADLTNRTNRERREELGKVIQPGEVIRLMPRKIVNSEKEIEEYFYESLSHGTEGIVVKKLDGTYKSGSRDFNWIKYKKSYDESGEADTIDAVVMGYDAGEGKRSGFGIGGFLIGVYDKKNDKFQTIAKIGTGLTDDEWREMNVKCKRYNVQFKPENYEVSKQMECDFWVKPVMVVEIKCDEITKSPMHTTGFALRFPRLISFREMKVEEAATPDEIKRLYELQKNINKGGGI
jgi:DNA ligase-1